MTTAASPGPSAAVDAAIASAASKAIACRGCRCRCLTKVAIRVAVPAGFWHSAERFHETGPVGRRLVRRELKRSPRHPFTDETTGGHEMEASECPDRQQGPARDALALDAGKIWARL